MFLSQALGLASIFFPLIQAATLTVSTTGGNASSPLLYGLMFEVNKQLINPLGH
jgi:alpha-N-arabinofuranosidase